MAKREVCCRRRNQNQLYTVPVFSVDGRECVSVRAGSWLEGAPSKIALTFEHVRKWVRSCCFMVMTVRRAARLAKASKELNW